MAENLGEAQLRLTVDLTTFQDDLRRARELITRELGSGAATSQQGQARRRQANASANQQDRRARAEATATEAEARRREREARAQARRATAEAKEQQRQIDRAARQGGAREGVRALEIAQERRFRLARRIDSLEERGVDIARLRLGLGRLTDAQIRRQFGSFRQLSQQLARQVTLEERRSDAQRRQQRQERQAAAIGAAQGGARESIFALERAQDRRFKLSQRINRLEERGANVGQIRTRLGELTTAYAQRQFGTARQLSRELERQVSLTEARARRERDVQRALERTARIGGAREPVQGRVDLPGSPRFLAEQRRREQQALRRAAQAGGPSEPISGRTTLTGSPKFLQEQARRRQQIIDRSAQLGGAAESIANFERLQEKRFRLGQRINALEQQGIEVAGFRSQLSRLDTAFAERQYGSAKRLTTELGRQLDIRQAQLRSTRELQRVGGPSEPIRGRTDLPGSPKFLEAQDAATKRATRETEQRRRREIAEGLRIGRQNASPIGGFLSGGQALPDSPAAKAKALALRSSWARFLKQLTDTKEVIDAAAQRNAARIKGPALPISGRLSDGSAVPGSPADLKKQAAQVKKVGTASGASSSIGEFNRLLADRRRLDLQLNELAAKGLNIDKLRDTLNKAFTALQQRQLGTARQLLDVLKAQTAEKRSQLRTDKQLAQGPSLPITGRLINGSVVPGSPADKLRRQGGGRGKNPSDVLRESLENSLGSGLIGGAFPLLFGQGLGASIGGGIGGAGGGFLGGQFGFGLSLVGTAVGAQFDQASQKLQTLGSALSDPISKFGELQQAGLLSSKGLERQIQALIDTGRQAEAAALIQQDLATTYGDLKTAQELARQADELNRSWSRLTVTLASFAVGPLAQAIGDTSDGLQGFTQVVQRLGEIIANIPKLPNVLPAPLQLPQPVQERVNQRIGGSLQTGILNLLNPLKPIFDLGSGLGGLFGSGKDKPATSSATSANAEASKKARQELLAITRQLISSEAQNNTVLSLGLKLRQSQLQEAQAIANLTETDPKARQVRVEEIQRAANEERARLREQAREAERSGIRDLNRARQLVGVYGVQRQIKEEQLKLDEARRVAEQAQRAYNASPTKDKGEANALNAAILKYRQTEIETAENIRRLEAERWANAIAAANKIKSIQEQTKIESLGINIGGTGRAVLEQLKARRDAQRAAQEAQANLAAAPTDEGLQQQAQQANESLKLASETTKNNLIAAYNAAKDSVRAISRSVQDAKLALAEKQNTRGKGVNKYLSPQYVQLRQEQLNEYLRKRAQAAANKFTNRTGIPVDITVTGTTEQRNAQLIDIARAFEEENRAVEDLVDVNKSLIVATNELTVATFGLTAANISIAQTVPVLIKSLNALVGKDWSVNVSVPTKNYNTPLPGF